MQLPNKSQVHSRSLHFSLLSIVVQAASARYCSASITVILSEHQTPNQHTEWTGQPIPFSPSTPLTAHPSAQSDLFLGQSSFWHARPQYFLPLHLAHCRDAPPALSILRSTTRTCTSMVAVVRQSDGRCRSPSFCHVEQSL
jgi:hypothetical protein